MRGLVVLATLACFAAAQHQALIDYLEQRLLAIEVRLSFLLPAGALRSRIQNKKEKKEKKGIFSETRHENWNVDVGNAGRVQLRSKNKLLVSVNRKKAQLVDFA